MNTNYPTSGVTSVTLSPRPSVKLLEETFTIDVAGRLCDLDGHRVGRKNPQTGYLQVWVGRKNCYVHHLLYIMAHGSIPAGRKVGVIGDRADVTVGRVHLLF